MVSQILSKMTFPLAEKCSSRSISRKLIQLKEEEKIISKDRDNWHKQNLYKITSHCINNVPYYKSLFRKIKFSPEKLLKDIRYYEDIPLLNKDLLKEYESLLIADGVDKDHLHIRKTNGSTGITTSVFYSTNALDFTAAANLYSLNLIGKKLSQREVFLVSRSSEFNFKESIINYGKRVAHNRVCISYDNLDDDSLYRIIKKLKSCKANVLLSPPSIIYALCKYIEAVPYLKIHFDKVVCTGEILDKKKKLYIENVLRTKVFDRYGNAEVGIIAQDTNKHELKVLEQMAYVQNNEDSGELIVTNYKNLSMPLLRYNTGDLAKVTTSTNGQFISQLEGRVGDMIYLNGSSIPTEFIKDTLFNTFDIDEFQILKTKADGHTISIVCNEKHQESVKNKIVNLWKGQLAVKFTTIDELVRVGDRKKFLYLVDET